MQDRFARACTGKSWLWLLVAGIGLLLGQVAPIVQAQSSPPAWSEPLWLNEGHEGNSPDVVADSSGAVHVFWGSYGGDDGPAAIYYRRLQDGVWSDPVDIIVGPDVQQAVLPQAAVDAQGWLHLVWDSNGVFYSRAPVAKAGSAWVWSPPIRLSEAQATTPQIIVDDEGRLHVVYVDISVSPYVRYTASEDGGVNWTTPAAVSAPQNTAYALNARLLVDHQRTLHMVWSESIEAFPPSGIYYARSTDLGQTWSAPLELAAGGYSWTSIGLDGAGALHVFWTGTGEWVGKYHTWSEDSGLSWRPFERLWPGTGGMLGFADMVVDSAGALHLVSAAGSGTFFPVGTNGEILHATWVGDRWSAPYHISLPVMDTKHEHSFPQISIGRGNTIHLVWGMLDHARRNQGRYEYVWYTTARLTTPELPSMPVPEPRPMLAIGTGPGPTAASPQGAAAPATIAPARPVALADSAPATAPPLAPVALAMASALALVLFVVLRQLMVRRSRRW